MQRILFVCLGNICRSPLAQGVFERLAASENLDGRFEVDSAGTGSYHVGERPHPGSQRVAAAYGISLDGQRARQLTASDFEKCDWLIAMDQSNLSHLLREAPHLKDRIRLLLDFADTTETEVHDPYYDDNFAKTFRQVQAGCRGLLDHLKQTL